MVKNSLTVITRQEAIKQGLKHYFTGEPCKYGHVAQRQISNRGCQTCRYAERINYYRENPERELVRIRERHKAYYQADPKKILEANKAWRLANHERAKENQRIRNAKAYSANPERKRLLNKIWKANNLATVANDCAKRRAGNAQRIPIWLTDADHAEIKRIYKIANQKTKETGIKWHVDHIIPLRGKNVSGLHVPQNLRVVPALENLRKSNKWDEPTTHQITKSGK
jgi:hypothetical protein